MVPLLGLSSAPPAALHRGTPEDKLRIIFDAYDEDSSGEIDEIEMRRMLSSTLTIESKAPPPLPSHAPATPQRPRAAAARSRIYPARAQRSLGAS